MSSSASNSPPPHDLIIPLFGSSASNNHELLDRLLRADPSHVQEKFTEDGLRELKYTHEDGLVCRLLHLDDAKPTGSTASKPVVATMFLVDISQYDRPISSSNTSTTTQLQRSLAHFISFANAPQYESTPIILLFSNTDDFAAKLPSSPLEKWFPELKETRDPWLLSPGTSDAMGFVASKFAAVRSKKADSVYIHYMPKAGGGEEADLSFIVNAIEDILSKEG